MAYKGARVRLRIRLPTGIVELRDGTLTEVYETWIDACGSDEWCCWLDSGKMAGSVPVAWILDVEELDNLRSGASVRAATDCEQGAGR